MNMYEVLFIVKADLDDKSIKETVSNFENVLKSMKAEIIDLKDLGQKRLAYPIKKALRGYYYLCNVKAKPAAIAEVDRKSKLDNNILRHLIIKKEE